MCNTRRHGYSLQRDAPESHEQPRYNVTLYITEYYLKKNGLWIFIRDANSRRIFIYLLEDGETFGDYLRGTGDLGHIHKLPFIYSYNRQKKRLCPKFLWVRRDFFLHEER